MARVVLKDVRKAFGKIEVIKGVNLEIQDREFVVFVGPSGCGKSTLLRLIAGLEEITDGYIFFDDDAVTDLPPSKRRVAMVFQSYALYPHMTVYENMAFGLKLAKYKKQEIDRRVRAAAQILQVEHLLDRKPKAMSGGQRQRVAIGRAIVREPKVFLFDEPLSNLDAALRVQMRIEITKLHNALNATMIYVTHDQVEAMTMADKIVVLNSGIVEQVGSPLELYNTPRNLFVAGFIGSPKMNFLPVTVEGSNESGIAVSFHGGGGITAANPLGVRVDKGQALTLGIRPEHMNVAEEGNFSGLIEVKEELGGETIFYVKTEAQGPSADPVVIRLNGHCPIERSSRIHLTMKPEDCHLFNASGLSLAARG